jgi:D-sedoheptulose 7-phosphate isomerase
MESPLPAIIADATRALESLKTQAAAFDRIAQAVVATLRSGGKLITCGNGGSAADALHLAEELVGRYKHDRRSLPALCLNADPTLITCIANDYGFDDVFSRQVESLAHPGDLLVCFTTSGNSRNILKALAAARAKGVTTVALLGKDGGQAKGRADFELVVDSPDTARVQEVHTVILHAWLDVVEASLSR